MDNPPQWSVHAEFTISHPGVNNPENPAKTDTVQDENGVRMSYSWKEDGSHHENRDRTAYAFHKGDICFTSTPPKKHQYEPQQPKQRLLPVPDSGYGSEMLSPSSIGRGEYHGYGRKCRSTCNIVLSANVQSLEVPKTQCGRTQSLRCQTPSACYDKPGDNFYGCGDPWCHHLRYGDDFSSCRRISPVREVCENPKCCESCTDKRALSESCATSFKSHDYSAKGDCTSCMGPESIAAESGAVDFKKFTHANSSATGFPYGAKSDSGVGSFATFPHCTSADRDMWTGEYQSHVHPETGVYRPHVHDSSSESFKPLTLQEPNASTFDCVANRFTPRGTVIKSNCEVGKGAFTPVDRSVKRDVSVQTYNMVNKCTSPMMKMDSSNSSPIPFDQKGDKPKRGKLVRSAKQYTKSIKSPSTSVDSNSLSTLQHALPKLSRSPTFRNITPENRVKKSPASDGKSSDSSKKPRTIHIDVYCTGTEMETDSSSSSESSRSKTVSTPQTVFETDKVCVTHEKAKDDMLPYNIRQKLQPDSKSENTSLEKDESDADEASTAYPSKQSSYSNIGYSFSSMSSFPNSATPYSMSSCTFPDFDSVGNTSWKDTFSDVGSLLNSRSSIAPNDSLYFVPKKIEEEVEEIKDTLPKPSDAGSANSILQPSDSFEYANSEDRLRIKRMERMWRSKNQHNQHIYPMAKRKSMQQQQKLQEAVNLRLSQIERSKDSESEASDDSEKGWSFVKDTGNCKTSVSTSGTPSTTISSSKTVVPSTRQGPVTTASLVTPAGLGADKFCITSIPSVKVTEERQLLETEVASRTEDDDPRDSNMPPCKSPSIAILQAKLQFNPNLRSPFTIVPGQYTEPRSIAKKFGPVIEVYRKPGHHVGPAKNPNCPCDHCRRHFETSDFRGRTCSLGDAPDYGPKYNWMKSRSYADI